MGLSLPIRKIPRGLLQRRCQRDALSVAERQAGSVGLLGSIARLFWLGDALRCVRLGLGVLVVQGFRFGAY